MNEEIAYCPKCGGRLDATNDLFVERPSVNVIEIRVMGKCRLCNHPYTWSQFYERYKETDIEDDSDEGDE